MDNEDPQKKSIDELLEVMAALRTPVTGCPWDLKQDFASIVPYTLEEAYEVADAISRGDMIDLREELGDLLLQVVYHARMAQELGAFDFSEVTDAITRKMVRRHPHVFGSALERAAGPVKGSWDRIKALEKQEAFEAKRAAGARADTGAGTGAPSPLPASGSGSILDEVPVAFPALVRAVKLQNKAAKVGFDWPSLAPVFDKMREEMAELEEVAVQADPRGEDDVRARKRVEEEFGDLLFVMANVARHLKIDPEAVLRGANAKFVRRFKFIEDQLAVRGKTAAESDLAEMDGLWDAAKLAEKDGG